MIRRASKLGASGAKVSLGNYGALNETILSAVSSFNYAPSDAETQEYKTLDDGAFQDVGEPGPGIIAINAMFTPRTPASKRLSKLHSEGGEDILNLLIGKQANIYDATATGVVAAKVVIETVGSETLATFTGGIIPFGTATRKGTVAAGHTLQVGTALWDIVDVKDQNYNQATKLILVPINGAADVSTPSDYRIYRPVLVAKNIPFAVTGGNNFTVDIGNSVSENTWNLAPVNIITFEDFEPLAWSD